MDISNGILYVNLVPIRGVDPVPIFHRVRRVRAYDFSKYVQLNLLDNLDRQI